MSTLLLTLNNLVRRLTGRLTSLYGSITILGIRFAAYCYTALRPGIPYYPLNSNKLRVLTVLPPLTNRRDEPIRCLLEHVSLEDFNEEYENWQRKTGFDWKTQPHKTRLAWIEHKTTSHGDDVHTLDASRYNWGDYVALSYCWGSTDDASARHIIMNGRYLQVTESLESALHLARIEKNLTTLPMGPAKIWIDALCIQQTHSEEKKSEIRRMKNIYGNSLGVFVHLGPFQEGDENRGIDVMQQIAKEVEECMDRDQYPFLKHRMEVTESNRKDFAALCRLLLRPYWRRLWILQELAMSDESSVIGCGDRKILFKDVILASKFVWHNFERFLAMVNLEVEGFIKNAMDLNGSMWVILFIKQLRELSQSLERAESVNYQNLEVALKLSQNGRATLSQDKAFGLLAVLPDEVGMRMELYFDIQLPKEAIFVEFTKVLMKTTNNLDVITLKSLKQKMTPSWATDWEVFPDKVNLNHAWHSYGYKSFHRAYSNLDEMIETARVSRADNHQRRGFRILGNSTLLSVSGIFIGTVDGVAGGLPGAAAEDQLAYTGGAPLQPKTQENPYGDDAATRRALLHTLFANPIWGDEEDAALFNIPWLYQKDYSEYLPNNFDPANEEIWKEKALRMLECGWDFFFNYGNYYSFELFRRLLGPYRIAGKPIYDFFTDETVDCTLTHDRVYLDMAKVVGGQLGRTLVTLNTGHFGLAPVIAKRDDLVYVIVGCSTPVVLRPEDGTSHYEVIGECYVEGFARGEAMHGLEDGKYSLEEITLC